MTDIVLSQFYTGEPFWKSLSTTTADAISSRVNPGERLQVEPLRNLEIAAYAAFEEAMGGDGLEGFLRRERYENDDGEKNEWALALEAYGALLDIPSLEHPEITDILFFSAVSLAAEKPNSSSQIISRFDLTQFDIDNNESWEVNTITKISVALLSLVKQSSLSDIEYSKEKINELSRKQSELEPKWLEKVGRKKALSLMALYHIAQATLETASYLESGYVYEDRGSGKDFEPELSQLLIKAEEFSYESGDLDVPNLVRLAGIINWKIFSNSIWRHIGGTSEELDEFIRALSRGTSKSIFSLLPAQQEAIKQALFDPTKLGIVLEMPTSSGKTLLAEMVIIQAIGNHRSTGKVLYIAPTRALASQVKRTLFHDLSGRGIEVTNPK